MNFSKTFSAIFFIIMQESFKNCRFFAEVLIQVLTVNNIMMKLKTGIYNGFIFTILLLLASCKKEKPLDEAILGKWEVVSMTQVTFENKVKKAELTIYFEANEMLYHFIDGGSGIFYEGSEDYLFSWTLSGKKLTISKLYTEDFNANLIIEDDNLIWSYEENDPKTEGISYQFIVNAKRVR